MLTPAFDLSQDPDFLTIAIRVPYARVSEFDVYFQGFDFKFYAKPYFLRLTLPGRIVENGSEQGSYDADKGIFTIQLPKETPGQHFEGLNMLTALLAPRKSRTAKPLVEEIGASEVSEEGVEDDDDDFDWEIEQSPYEEVSESALNVQSHYGFGGLRSGVFQRLQDEFSDVIDIKDPDFTPPAERRQKRLAAEMAKFDPDHYLADFFEDEVIEQILKYNPWWTDTHSEMLTILGKSQEQEKHAALVSFSEEEKYQLRKFVHKSYLLDKRAHHQVYYSLIDILLAYCYETRVSEGEKNVESAWNIRKLSSTLCWLEFSKQELEHLTLLENLVTPRMVHGPTAWPVSLAGSLLAEPSISPDTLVQNLLQDLQGFMSILKMEKCCSLDFIWVPHIATGKLVFVTWTNVHEVLVSFGRRVLCYPLYRHFKLVMEAYRDTIKILQLGKSAVLKCLLDIHKIFQESDPAYILNDLYISDYCVWIQKAKSKKLAALAKTLSEVSLTKAQLGLEVEELEEAARLVQEEEAAMEAAHSVSGPQTSSCSSEASDVEDSDSTTSSETEDSDSEQEELRNSESETVNSLQGPFLEERSALLIDGGVCRNSAILPSDVQQGKPQASPQALGGFEPLIEELGKQLKTTVQISGPKGSVAGNLCCVQDEDD